MITEGNVTISLEDFRKMEKVIEQYNELKRAMREAVTVRGEVNLEVNCINLRDILCHDVDLAFKFEEVEYDVIETIEFVNGGKDDFNS